ncbi:MAG: LysR family transcriptional regulator [Lachnospiraceae bacterium]|nr:LysR family transcriptional regulator [Lachnospiraceae bacterium]
MIEIKQLQYFVVCANLSSFSRAADVLYTSQANVSKVIKSLEKEMGCVLFVRKNRGVELTERGKQVYRYASCVIDNMQRMTDSFRMRKEEELLLSWNPSSWLAAVFADFYQENEMSNVGVHIMSVSTEEMMGRVASGQDEIGFCYLLEEQLPLFQYRLDRNKLEFLELKRTELVLYFGAGKAAGASDEDFSMEKVNLVQCYEDEFTMGSHADFSAERKETLGGAKVAVITNSDYVMNRLLQRTDLGNISGAYLNSEDESAQYTRVSLRDQTKPVVFGCMQRTGEKQSFWAEKFLDFVRKRMDAQV